MKGGKIANDPEFMKKMMEKVKIGELAKKWSDRCYVEKRKKK